MHCQGSLKASFNHDCVGTAGLGAIKRCYSGDQHGSHGFSSHKKLQEYIFGAELVWIPHFFLLFSTRFLKGVSSFIFQMCLVFRFTWVWELFPFQTTDSGFVVKAGLWFSSWKMMCCSLSHSALVFEKPRRKGGGVKKEVWGRTEGELNEHETASTEK